MKLNLLVWFKQDEGKTLARFGATRLVKKATGRIELLGGDADDRTAVKEWVSLFLHEAIVRTTGQFQTAFFQKHLNTRQISIGPMATNPNFLLEKP